MKFKNIFFYSLILLLVACNQSNKEETAADQPEIENVDAPEEKTAKAQKVTDRD